MTGTGKIQHAARSADESRKKLFRAWRMSEGPWADVKRDQLGERYVEPLLEEAERYQRALDQAAREAAEALSMLNY